VGIRFVDRKNPSKWGLPVYDVLDGLSNTAAMSERSFGDDVDGPYNVKGDYVREDLPDPTAAVPADDAIRAMCLASTSTDDQNSAGGQQWWVGSYQNSLFNTLTPPNSKLVFRLTGAEGCHPPTSYHPGGVNVMMADGSVRFVRESTSTAVWAAVGGRKDGITVSGGDL
jgi:prepilin-type processing-associated H-X9-DG protein